MTDHNASDPMAFLRNLWGGNGFALPGMVTPTIDTDELDKRIKDLKTVEGWLRTNLSMLSMTIQNLEMQRTTLGAMRNMGEMLREQASQPTTPTGPAAAAAAGAMPGIPPISPEAREGMAQAAMWPWTMMQQMQEQMQEHLSEATKQARQMAPTKPETKPATAPSASKKPAATRARSRTTQKKTPAAK